ncbi:PREDICTED: macrophage colony-stimulating factor 1 receptor [Nanorana parkeri]|uniref:macrophage colony-stimulating factor 1 receptor n=1 Tax=Nanorana parkeri TaxID=125878 RepID=UPI00085403AD|nr:PREDICTED: macrophage colony-stimulating factor 1 receptor [Nanorana parkeri]
MGTAVLALLVLASLRDGLASLVIKPSGNEIVVQNGEPLNLTCTGNENAKWNFTNVQQRLLVQKKIQVVNNTVKIPKAGYSNVGTYTCSSNSTNSSEQASVHVFVKDATKLWNTLTNTVRIDEDEDALLPCLLTDPSLALHEISLTPLIDRSPNVSFDAKKGFYIYNVQMADEGDYFCQVKGFPKGSSKIKLIVNEVPKDFPSVTLSSLENIRIQGESFEIKCTSISTIMNSQITWEHAGKNVTKDQKYQFIEKNWIVESTLQILNVDFSDSGHYTCTGDLGGKSSRVSANLQVIEKACINISTSENQSISLLAGQSVGLTVIIEAYPDILSWNWVHHTSDNALNVSTQGNMLPNGSYRSTSTLILNRMQENEEGTYTFYAANSQTNASLSFNIILYKPPKVEISITEFNGTHSVTCNVKGTPRPEIQWLQCSSTSCIKEPIKGEVIDVQPGEVKSILNFNESVSNMTILCLASNLAGNHSAPVKFTSHVYKVTKEPELQFFNTLLIAMAVVGAFLLLLSMFLFYKYQQKPKFEVRWQIVQVSEGNHYTCIDPTQLPYNEKWEFPRTNLQFGKTLGAGAFGKVMEATAFGMGKDDSALTVAVKMLKPSAHSDEKEALMSELKILSHLGHHQNIVNLLGACTSGGPILVITEYCPHGDLLNFLRRKTESINDMFTAYLTDSTGNYKNISVEQKYVSDSGCRSEGVSSYVDMKPVTSRKKSTEGNSLMEEDDTDDHLPLDLYDLLNFSLQVAQGMSFLASKNCIHRDVAARNVLVTQGRVAKICDFGLARDIENDSNYVVKGNARLPVKWMAPESIFDCIYTVQSDVWSYGIFLWEMFSLGRSPYPGVIVNRKFYKMIKEGYKMDCPDYAPLDIYRLMKSCWDLEPTNRPTFSQITDLVNKQMSLNKDQEYANIISGQQDEDCMVSKCMDTQEPLIKGNNYQFC